MRLPYTANPPTPSSAADAAVVARIQARRAPRPLQPLDLALLHSPAVADGWNSFLGAVRTRTAVAADLRELAVCRVAAVNRAWYEWAHHAPLAAAAGVSAAGLARVRDPAPLRLADVEGRAELGDRAWTVLVYTDEMTRDVEVRDETFAALRALFGEKDVVEITATVRGLLRL